MASCGSGDLQAAARVDDAPRVDGRAHVRIAASARQVEQSETFHEERPFLAEEDRKSIVHFHFERVAFHLAEIRIHRPLERDGRRHAVLDARAELTFRPRIIPRRRGVANLIV